MQTITVGPPGSGADVEGETGAAVQQAVDAAAFRGGGRVRVAPGTYRLADSIHLKDGIALVGTPGETILTRTPAARANLTVSADFGQLKLTVDDASPFNPGDGITVMNDQRSGGWRVSSQLLFRALSTRT